MKLILLLIPLLFFITSCSIDWNDEKEYEIRCTNNYTQEQSGNTFSSTESCLKEACNK